MSTTIKSDLVVRPLSPNALVSLCQRVVDRSSGSNNGDMKTNGELTLLRHIAPRVKTIFDVGTNIGEWAASVLEINPGVNLHCFEPDPTTFANLEKRSFPSNVRLNQIGLSDKPGETELFTYGELHAMNSIYLRTAGVKAHSRQKIELSTVDLYCQTNGVDRVDFLKIDVEGHELAVVRGAEQTLRAGRVGLAQFEYGGTYIDSRTFLKDVWDFITQLDAGYQFYKLFPDGLRHAPSYQPRFEDFQYSNWVFARQIV